MITTTKASLDLLALSMMSNTYFFQHTNPLYLSSDVIGDARVSAVVINEDSSPHLLLDPLTDDHPAFYPIDALSFSAPSSFTC